MHLRKFLFLAAIIPLSLGGCSKTTGKIEKPVKISKQTQFHESIKPLGDVISKGEGDYDAVNRGYAGDTPQGIDGLTGKEFKDFTIEQVLSMQDRWIYAVGRYQFIPSTLRFAVKHSNLNLKTKFTNETQDILFSSLILHKRPSVAAYLRGDHNLLGWALDDLSKEWASIEYRNGRGYHDHVGGNRAKITREEVKVALNQSKNNVLNNINKDGQSDREKVQHFEFPLRPKEV